MLFNSLPFLFFFLPVSLAGYQLAGYFSRRAVLVWLAAVSLFFYAAWNRGFVLLLIGSVLVNYGVSLLIARSPAASHQRKVWLYAGILLNVSALFYYKYLFHILLFLADTKTGSSLGISAPQSIVLPLGISFFTFTQVGYLIDLAQNQAEEQDLLSYLLFVTFFPHLIAGPLLHHREIMPQFDEAEKKAGAERKFQIRLAEFAPGLTLFVFGLAKKVLIADKLAPAADSAFASVSAHGLLSAWSGILIYCMQLYFDFSGYSDMAIGIARMFGIRFPWNFNSPWKATNITDYWKRWHMTLSRYVTLYLYNPVLLSIQRRRIASGRKISRKSLKTLDGFMQMVFLPLMITMLITGIWHGAGLQFAIFGGLHGLYLSAHQAWKHFRPDETSFAGERYPQSAPGIVMLKRLGVLVQVAFALVFFRAATLQQGCRFTGELLGFSGVGHLSSPGSLLAAAALLPVVWYLPNTQQMLGEIADDQPDGVQPVLLRWRPGILWGVGMAIVLFASLVNLNGASSFVYFQF